MTHPAKRMNSETASEKRGRGRPRRTYIFHDAPDIDAKWAQHVLAILEATGLSGRGKHDKLLAMRAGTVLGDEPDGDELNAAFGMGMAAKDGETQWTVLTELGKCDDADIAPVARAVLAANFRTRRDAVAAIKRFRRGDDIGHDDADRYDWLVGLNHFIDAADELLRKHPELTRTQVLVAMENAASAIRADTAG